MSSWKNVLGWVPGDSLENTKRKYRSLALKLHPNKNPGKNTTAEFQSIQSAWDEAGRAYGRSSPAPTQSPASSSFYGGSGIFPDVQKAREDLARAWRKAAEKNKEMRNGWGIGSNGKAPKNVRFQFKKIERSAVLRGKPTSTGDEIRVHGADIIDTARRLFSDELGGSIPDCYQKRFGVKTGHVSASDKYGVLIHGPRVKYEEVIVVRRGV